MPIAMFRIHLFESLNGMVAFTVNVIFLAFLRLTVNFLPLRLTEILKINFHCF